MLLVSELVTNAVLHTRTDPDVTLRLNDGRLWIGVRDGSPVTPAPKRYGPEAATGRGLQLVEQVAARWGVEKASSGKVVWFELDEDSAMRYATAQEAALLEDFAAIEMELGEPGEATIRPSGDQSTGPSSNVKARGASALASSRLPVFI